MNRAVVKTVTAGAILMWIGWVSFTLNAVSRDLARIKERLGMNPHEVAAGPHAPATIPPATLAAVR